MNDVAMLEKLNPCVDCDNYGTLCSGVDGDECNKANAFIHVSNVLKQQSKELQITRDYIHSMNLEWDLISYLTRLEKDK